MNPGAHSQSFLNLMGDSSSPQGAALYGPSGIPTYINENFECSRSPTQINENYGFMHSGGPSIKSENYGSLERSQLNREAYGSSPHMMNPYEPNGGPSVPSLSYGSPKPSYGSPKPNYGSPNPNYGSPHEAQTKSETYSACENTIVKSEPYVSSGPPIKNEPYWSSSSTSAHHPSEAYGYGSTQTYGSSVNQEYSLPMPQDYLQPANHMNSANSSEQSYHGQIAKIKEEMGVHAAQPQSPITLPNQLYPQMSSAQNKHFERHLSLQNPGYQSPVSLDNPLYDAHVMSSRNHMYDQQPTSSQSQLYQQSLMSSQHGQAYHPSMSMSSNSHLYQQAMSSHANSNPYQQYPMYNNSNPYSAPSSSSYPPFLPQNPWTNFNTGFSAGADSYPDTVVNCSPKKKSKTNHTNTSKKEPIQIVSQQHFHSKRGIYTFQMQEMHLASASTFSISDSLLMIEKKLCENLIQIDLPDNVCYVYNPLEYAFNPHRDYTEKFCSTQKQILFLGMNPGPFGMSQNGVPFGEYNIVRDWLKVSGEVSKPLKEHPKRLIVGLDCKRSEVTGSRFWGYFRRLCGTPENFFRHCFVYNICPMAFMSDSGKNITPPQIPAHVLKAINTVCNTSLIEVIQLLNVKTVIGVGNYAYNSAQKLLSSANMEHIKVHVIMHPSPINPAANKGWDNIARDQLKNIGILELLQGSSETNGDYN